MWNVAVVMPCADRPVHRPRKHRLVVVVHAEDEAAVDHDAEVVQAIGDGGVVAAEVLALVAAARGWRASSVSKPTKRLRSPASAALSTRSPRRIESTVAAPWNSRPMPRMPSKSAAAKRAIAEQVIVEEVQMPARQPIDLGERVVHALGVEGSAALEERVLVAEVAVLRAAARDDDRVRDEVRAAADQIAADRRHALERAAGRARRSGAAACRRGSRRETAGTSARPGRGRSRRRAPRLRRAARSRAARRG